MGGEVDSSSIHEKVEPASNQEETAQLVKYLPDIWLGFFCKGHCLELPHIKGDGDGMTAKCHIVSGSWI